MNNYDVAIIGSGPGGYVCAIRCAQLGMKTAIIEKYNTLGGTCLNVGCIPSKAMLDSSHQYHDAVHKFADHGINVGTPKIDFKQMVARKQSVVDQMTKGVDFLMKKNKIDVYTGLGSFIDANTLQIDGKKKDKITAKNIVIATGSKPSALPGVDIDKKRIITSTEALELKEIPKHLIVIGGGVIGLELGSVYNRLGADVSVVEYADSLIASMDRGLGKEMARISKKQGMKIHLNHKVTSVSSNGKKVTVKAEGKKKSKRIGSEEEEAPSASADYRTRDGLRNSASYLSGAGCSFGCHPPPFGWSPCESWVASLPVRHGRRRTSNTHIFYLFVV